MSAAVVNLMASCTGIAWRACPICGGHDLPIYLSGASSNLTASALGSSRREHDPGTIRRCADCGFAFKEVRETQEELTRLYRDLDSSVYERESRGRLKTARRHLRIVEKHTGRGRLLDVGCASGVFLNCALQAGWIVCGVEPAGVLAAKAQALLANQGQVFRMSLQDANLPRESFDVITLWDVLEHVSDPVSMLRHCRELLRPGGHLFANVPDIDSLQSRVLRARWPLLLPEHLNYFTQRSLRRCGELTGLDYVTSQRRPASFSVEYILYRLMQHRVTGAGMLHRLTRNSALKNLCLPVMLGELCGIWRHESRNFGNPKIRGPH